MLLKDNNNENENNEIREIKLSNDKWWIFD